MKRWAYMLYEGDCWLSNHSLVCMGVFTNKRKLQSAIRRLVKDQIMRRLFLEERQFKYRFASDVCREVLEKGQYSGCDASICVKTITLNQFEEI